MGQSRISMQLSQLKQAGLVEVRRAGQKSLYQPDCTRRNRIGSSRSAPKAARPKSADAPATMKDSIWSCASRKDTSAKLL